MKTVVDFLSKIQTNNNRDWFEANKDEYRAALAEFNLFVERLIEGVAAFDASVAGLAVKDCTYRIYRDVRFGHNKDPYKNHMGAYICRGGKKSGYAGYYFHIQPDVKDVDDSGSFMVAGLHMPEPNVLKSLRDEISDNGKGLVYSIESAKGFELMEGDKLKRLPKGFEVGSPYDEYLKHKEMCIIQHIDNAYLLQGELAERIAGEFSKTRPFIDYINRSVGYAFEQME